MDSRAPRIAVIDDEEPIRRLLTWELEAAGFEVRGARDALCGLDMIREFDPALILLDVMMPKIDGISVSAALPRVDAGADLHPQRQRRDRR